jgi:hypothetical protein
MPRLVLHLSALMACGFALTGCQTYVAPGAPADLRALGFVQPGGSDPGSINNALVPKQRATVSTLLAIARVQAAGFSTYTGGSTTKGPVSLVTQIDSEDPADVAKLSKLYGVRGTLGLNKLVLPDTVSSEADLRKAAAETGADVLIVYTIDTQFFVPQRVEYGQAVKLPLVTDPAANVQSTASGILVDVRSGRILGQAQGAGRAFINAGSADGGNVIDRSRRNAEKAAFAAMTDEVAQRWTLIIERGYAAPGAVTP